VEIIIGEVGKGKQKQTKKESGSAVRKMLAEKKKFNSCAANVVHYSVH
jgi:hypothetical protein